MYVNLNLILKVPSRKHIEQYLIPHLASRSNQKETNKKPNQPNQEKPQTNNNKRNHHTCVI